MSDNEQSKKYTSFVQGVRQELIDELMAVSDKWKVGEDGTNFETLQEERLAVLNRHEQQAESAEEILGQLAIDLKAAKAFGDGGPWKLNDLLVSGDSWPFEDLSQVDEHFGPLPAGYCYRNLLSEARSVPKAVVNNANNLLRLPSAFNLLVDADFELAGDGIPGRTLLDWIHSQSAALNRLWTMRILAYLAVLEGSELPEDVPYSAGVPSIDAAVDEPVGNLEGNQRVQHLVDEFIELTLVQYDGQEEENDVTTIGIRIDKARTFKALNEIPGGCAALRPLLTHSEIAVRVSAAIYLLLSAPQLALPVLQEVAATWPGDEKKKHSQCACLNAQRALWMYVDGKLSYDA